MAKDKPEGQTPQETVTTPTPTPMESGQVGSGQAGQQGQTQLQLDDSNAQAFYSSTSRIWGSAEEIIIDFSQGVRPSGKPNVAVLKVDSRVILSPWAAKRLALALSQSVQRYEQAYGALEIDPRKRQQGGGAGAPGGAEAASTTSAM